MNNQHFKSNMQNITHAKISSNPRMSNGALVWDTYFVSVEFGTPPDSGNDVTFVYFGGDNSDKIGIGVDIKDASSFDPSTRIYHFDEQLINIQFYQLTVV